MRHVKHRRILLSISALFVIVTYYYRDRISCILWPSRGECSDSEHRLRETPHRANTTSTRTTILFWTKYFDSKYWDYSDLGTKPFEHDLCKYRCYATVNRRHLSSAGAVVFHYADMHDQAWPEVAGADVPRVLVVHESPQTTKDEIKTFDNNINLVMSYRRDSDIYAPYRVIQSTDGATGTVYTPHVPLASRNKSVVWVVSNCEAASHREMYVKELSRYIDVDIYGKCGTKSCPKDEWWRCMTMFASTYKFYLSFENSLCVDYVTEKLYEALRHDIVPVVMSGDKLRLPGPLGRNDVINIRNFDSPRQLANFLHRLGTDEDSYNMYFRRKSRYKVVNTHGPLTQGLCTLCEWLHTGDKRLQSGYHKDLYKWWNNASACDNDFILEQSRLWSQRDALST